MIQTNRVYQHTQSWGLPQVAIAKTTQQPEDQCRNPGGVGSRRKNNEPGVKNYGGQHRKDKWVHAIGEKKRV